MTIDPVLAWTSALVPAVIFGVAASRKLGSPRIFRVRVAKYSLLPAWLVTPVARALPCIEGIVAVGLIFPPARSVAALAGTGLLGLFMLAIAINLHRGHRDLDCGCQFGGGQTLLSPALLVRNLVLALWMLPALWDPSDAALGWLGGLTVAIAVLVGLLAYVAVEDLLQQRRFAMVGVR